MALALSFTLGWSLRLIPALRSHWEVRARSETELHAAIETSNLLLFWGAWLSIGWALISVSLAVFTLALRRQTEAAELTDALEPTELPP